MDKELNSHITREFWEKANEIHIGKIISEFAHESIIKPSLQETRNGWGIYKLITPGDSSIIYHFEARVLKLNHWLLKKGSVKKMVNGKSHLPESIHFILEFQQNLEIPETLLPGYLEEITATLYGSMFILKHNQIPVNKLVNADYQTIEHAMFNGHPIFVANNGRVGFDAEDYRKYAPEANQSIQLVWLAGHKSRASFNAVEELPYENLMKQELGEAIIQQFNRQLAEKGLNPDEYVFIPVHPWQWDNKLAILFAPDIVANQLVLMGSGPDIYLVQQSLRTLFNISNPEKFYTKTALSILNMGFLRGMSPYFMDTTPAITTWIKSTIGKDPYIKSLGFTMLCEVATVGYRNFTFEKFGQTSSYNKMLAALWRESPASITKKGQQLMTMAALIHIDHENQALLPEIIKNSGFTISDWLRKYLRCYLAPLLHAFYEHDLSFIPHGENVILVLENHIPVKIIMKDITEEINVLNPEVKLPEKAQRIYLEIPDDIRMLNILIDVFDGFFRFVTAILEEYCQFTDEEFWRLVAECIHDYQQENTHLERKFKRFDLFVKEYDQSCLNRLQLRNHRQMFNSADPVSSFQLVGRHQNPIYKYRHPKKHNIESAITTA
ncbi:hypothetical protein ATO12_16655 [Sporocytophaga myxococcoides]|uniref:IucA/IucC family protein n=1 Tax=Sporocytophaga myxococcoides TaxID=153721 RepID=A0A098LD68_9BACT|nr:IucA/IucC family siderophore biosynthesis protein [Sporocytophaga myxococcoides]GAL84855.1 hypothetical protein ATO12_16655 [Sporocytophaga myxococcoides]